MSERKENPTATWLTTVTVAGFSFLLQIVIRELAITDDAAARIISQ